MLFPDEPVPLEVVRDIAALLRANDLSEIALETKGDVPTRLRFERETFVLPVAAPTTVALDAAPADAEVDELSVWAAQFNDPAPTGELVDVLSPCVGLFRAGKKSFADGDEVKAKSILGFVEALRVPNEVFAPQGGRIAETLVAEGEGVEWGQTLFRLEVTP